MKLTLVKDAMKNKENVISISPFAKVRDVLQAMKRNNVKSVIVEKTHEHDAYGIVTYSNILSALLSNDGDMDLLNVYDIASKPLIQIGQELDIKYAAKMMTNHKVTRLIVTHNGVLDGLLTMNDIMKVLLTQAEEDLH
ncbi:MAG: CBS domain-containing protein [Campylobacterota bacterium]|nr:CBS domain-containing protein [Campylobacterota bacterium]